MGSLQPGYKPSLVMIFACLGDIHAERHQKTKRKADLDEAISATRLALSISSADHPINTTLLNNLANGLWQRYQSIENEDDLHQALFYALQALDSISHDDSNRAAVLATLGAIRASFYECHGEYQNLQEAIVGTRKSIDITIQCEGAASLALLNNLGAYMWTQYGLTSRREDLDQSVISFFKALESESDSTADRVGCLVNCVQVLNQRYHRTGQLEDLSRALEIAQEAMRLDPENADLATLLKHLDHFLDRRRGHQFQGHWSKGEWKMGRELWKLLILLTTLLTILAMYHYHFRTEILLSMIAFPCGIMFRSILNRSPQPKKNTMKNTFRSLKFVGALFGPRDGPQEYTPKLLAVPLIPVPFTSSLRGIQTSDVSAYSSLLHKQRQSSNSDRGVRRRSPVGHERGRNTQRHKGRHASGHRPMSPHERHPGKLFIAATSPGPLMRRESPQRHLSSAPRTIRPQVEVEFSRNGSNTLESIHTDSGYGSYNNIHDRTMEENRVDEDQKVISRIEQQHQPNTIPENYSQPTLPQNIRNAEQISSPLVPSQNPWAEPGDSYPEHNLWERYQPSTVKAEEENVRVIHQGHTKLEMDTNSGLAMGNVTSQRAAIVGYVASRESQPRRQSSYHETSMSARSEDAHRKLLFQEEEVQVAPVQEIADFQAMASIDTSVELQVEAPVPSVPLDSIVDNLMQSQAPRIVEVEEEEDQEEADPIIQAAEQVSDVDLVDQLVWEYMESLNL